MYLFSIIVPCYNVSERVDTLFEMLSDKDHSKYEVVFVDDCSKDGSYQKMLEKSASYPNYKVVQPEKNGGPGPARNFGISHAEGEYILFCDSDDLFDVSCLAKIEEFLRTHPDADTVVCPHTVNKNDKNSENRVRDYAIITLFLNCGMRVSELTGIDINDVDRFLRSVRILGKGNKERILYFNDACRAALEEYITEVEALVGGDNE